jgi:XTP/dITP diphosphohydrolase
MDPDSSIPSSAAVVCTGNAHKVRELDALLPGLRLEPLPTGTVLPPEIGETFLDNARIKAHAGAAMLPGRWVLADDSGLIVDSLDGRPGVHSARFAGENATDDDNVRLLLRELEPFHDPDLRAARFACVLVAIAPDGTEHHAEGFVEGRIAEAPSGDGGFGYDPVFVPTGHDESFAELGDEIKAGMSHRAAAASTLRTNLAGIFG